MRLFFAALLLLALAVPARAQVPFEEATVDVGNVGLTLTNAGFVGRSNVRNNPTGAPSFEYPLNSGVEHLFEAGLWIGAIRADGLVAVRSGAITSSSGYRAGAAGYEFAQTAPFTQRSSLPTSPFFTPSAVSHQDFLTAYVDTAQYVPGTLTPFPDFQGRLGIAVDQRSYAYSFPFAESFVIVEFNIVNTSGQPWDSVFVGLYHDLVVRNVNTVVDAGSAFFNKGGLGYLDTLQTTYAFNAGGAEESVNTYGAISFLGARWRDPQTGQRRFFHPNVAAAYRADGLPAPRVNPRWWLFSGATDPDLNRPQDDRDRYTRMGTPYPDPASPGYAADSAAFYATLRTGGQSGQGNWIGMTAAGPFARVAAGDTLQVTWAFVAARKPEAFQGQAGKAADTDESRSLLVANVGWARRTFAGEDLNYNGQLDAGEDANGNGRLDRYLIPEPPRSPNLHVELAEGTATLYWDASAEASRDPVTGQFDFEGYRVYRTRLGDDRSGDFFGQAALFAQFDRVGNRTGFNNGFAGVRLDEPVTFAGDTTRYVYKLDVDGLLSGWQYGFAVTAFDEGDVETGLPSFESSRLANAARVFPGTPAASDGRVGVYPNPYRVSAAWDGATNQTRKLYFYNLPARAEIRIYTLAGEVVDSFEHEGGPPADGLRWYDDFSSGQRVEATGEAAWDLLSANRLNLSTGMYLFSVRDHDTGRVQTGRFVIIR